MTRIKVYIALVTAMLLWAFSFIWYKQALEIYQPFTILFFRLTLATLTLFMIAKPLGWLHRVKKKDWKTLLLLSFFEPFLYFVGESLGMQYVSATVAAVMISLIPLFMPFAGRFFFREKLSVFHLMGLIISVSGVLIMIFGRGLVLDANPAGIAFMLVAVIAAVAYSVILKGISTRYNAFTIVCWQNLIASFCFLPLFLHFEYKDFAAQGFSPEGFRYILFLGFFCSNGAFLLYTYGIRHIGISKAAIFSNLIPLFAALLSFFIFREQLGGVKYAGIALVLAGLIVAEWRRGRM